MNVSIRRLRFFIWFYSPSRLFHLFWVKSISTWGENRWFLRKTPDHPQAELGLSHMWPVLGSNPQWWDDKLFGVLKVKDLNHLGMGVAPDWDLRYQYYHIHCIIRAASWENLSVAVSDQERLKPVYSAMEAKESLVISGIATIELNFLGRSTVWSQPLLITYGMTGFLMEWLNKISSLCDRVDFSWCDVTNHSLSPFSLLTLVCRLPFKAVMCFTLFVRFGPFFSIVVSWDFKHAQLFLAFHLRTKKSPVNLFAAYFSPEKTFCLFLRSSSLRLHLQVIDECWNGFLYCSVSM